MGRILVAYSTVDGHTRKICERLRDALKRDGHAAELVEIRQGTDVEPSAFDAVVLGASIRYGHHRPEVHAFVESHRAALERMPCAFFSVNLVARKPGRDTADANQYVRKFLEKTRWAPRVQAAFAGKLDYAKYGVLDRLVIRFIMWLTGGPTDRTACVDFTDWAAVDAFAKRVSSL
ncbi:MAG TPA: menaquinone-dependent protoporphyrinogen IX dehydrogenase [Caldimonas sp.]|nr:menaquinone-dependent protoporphyrinogen IX dehydrogenase [Caldimonas sp.]